MIYTLYRFLEKDNWLAEHGMGFFRVFGYANFRAIVAIILSFLLVLFTARPVIRWLLKQKIGDNPEFGHADLNQIMKQKINTPTMGGVLISGAILICTLLLADLTSFYVIMALLCLIWLSLVGGFDDWLKLTSARRTPGSREGLKFWEKIVFQLGLAVILGIFIHHYGVNKFVFEDPEIRDMSHSLTLPFLKSWQYIDQQYVPNPSVYVLGTWLFVVLTILVIAGSSNAVNLTDGMDGLASGITGICAFALMILALIACVLAAIAILETVGGSAQADTPDDSSPDSPRHPTPASARDESEDGGGTHA